jgi:DHA1 family tetracycline resistance protein-like MFS transporter
MLSDRVGRRPVLLISGPGFGLDYVLMAVAPSLWLLLVGRIVCAITAATVTTACAYIANVPPENEGALAFVGDGRS